MPRLSLIQAFVLAIALATTGCGSGLHCFSAMAYGAKTGKYDTARRVCESEAKLGSAEAAYQMGRIYARGFGVPENDSYAAEWYLQAARDGHHLAQLATGENYAYGVGVKADYVTAYMYLTLAKKDRTLVARAEEISSHISPLMTDKEILRAKRLALNSG